MLKTDIIKQAAKELEATETHQVVKVASILSRLRAWYNSLVDPQYQKNIETLKAHSAQFKDDMRQLAKYMDEVDQSIQSGDLDRYNASIDELKRATVSLSNGLKILNEDAQMATAPPEAQGTDRSMPRVLFRPETLQSPYIRPAINNAFKKAGLKDNEINSVLSDPQFLKDVEDALQNGQMVGSAVEVKKGKNENRIGEMWVTYQSPTFELKNYAIEMQVTAVLTDMSGRENNPLPVMSVTRFADIKVYVNSSDQANDERYASQSMNKFIKNADGFDWAFKVDKIEALRKKYNWSNYVEAKKTPINRNDFINAIKNVWSDIFPDIAMTEAGVGVLWSQAALETGNFKSMYNFNLGNVKATPSWSANNLWTSFPCHETIKGKSVGFTKEHPVCFWRAYEDLEGGMKSYLEVMGSERYRDALLKAIQGDAVGFIHGLKSGGYFSAPVDRYSKAVSALYKKYKSDKEKAGVDITESPSEEVASNLPPHIQEEVSTLMNYFKEIAATPLTDIVKQSIADIVLPRSELTIKIKSSGDNYPAKVEYASVLSGALLSAIEADTDVYSDGNDVELVCSVAGDSDSVTKAVAAINTITAKAFASKHKGNLVYGSIKPNTISKLAHMDEFKVERERRKFYLKARV